MLVSLRIKNLALIEDLTWELGPGFNTLTGETGAGKSILIDALAAPANSDALYASGMNTAAKAPDSIKRIRAD